MTDFISDTPYVGRRVCPGCEVVDPIAEVTETHWCQAHCPPSDGLDDASVVASAYITGNVEAEGETCKAWGDWLAGRA